MLGYEAHLSRRRPRGIAHQHAFDLTFLRKLSSQFRPYLVLTNQPDEDAAGAERGDVAGDIAGAADIGLAALDRNDRRGRFRRNPRYLAVDKFVEHEVSDAQHRLADNRMRKGVKIEHRNSSSVAPSAETIGTIEVTLDVSLDRLFQRGEAAVVAGALQPIAIALGEVLVAAANLLGHVDILDIRNGAERGICREHQFLEAAGLAGADIEDAADRGRR